MFLRSQEKHEIENYHFGIYDNVETCLCVFFEMLRTICLLQFKRWEFEVLQLSTFETSKL